MLQQLIQIFKQVIPNDKIDYTTVNEDTKLFNDLCHDSSVLTMVAYAIQDKFDIKLPGFLEIRNATVGDIINMINAALKVK